MRSSWVHGSRQQSRPQFLETVALLIDRGSYQRDCDRWANIDLFLRTPPSPNFLCVGAKALGVSCAQLGEPISTNVAHEIIWNVPKDAIDIPANACAAINDLGREPCYFLDRFGSE